MVASVVMIVLWHFLFLYLFTSSAVTILSLNIFSHYPIQHQQFSLIIRRHASYSQRWRLMVARTSAAGMPSGGRHCNSTSCSRDTSFPRGSCSNDFFRSERQKRQQTQLQLKHTFMFLTSSGLGFARLIFNEFLNLSFKYL